MVRNNWHEFLVSCIFKVRLLGQYFTIGAPSSVNILEGVLAGELLKRIIAISQGLQIHLIYAPYFWSLIQISLNSTKMYACRSVSLRPVA